ncbi:MAG: C-GCAxxG-C-C family protein [Elusimicrobia bacterium]|nr:C-GCAxxG-C-C family protein [Elusimicrobiota bacterium]
MENKKVTKAQTAAEKFISGCRCSEVILTLYGEEFGLNQDLAMKIGCAFGGGLGGSGDVCGAVTGAIAILGLKFGRTRNSDVEGRARTDALVRRFLKRFRSAHKHLRCNDLIGYDRSTAQGHEAAATAGVFKELCPRFVEDAAIILEDMLGEA